MVVNMEAAEKEVLVLRRRYASQRRRKPTATAATSRLDALAVATSASPPAGCAQVISAPLSYGLPSLCLAGRTPCARARFFLLCLLHDYVNIPLHFPRRACMCIPALIIRLNVEMSLVSRVQKY